MRKPDLYLDFDGVFSGFYDGSVQLRPNMIGFLRFCVNNFNCYWLTSVPKDMIDGLLFYAEELIDDIEYLDWKSISDEKVKSVDLDRPFYWVEDGLTKPAHEILISKNCINRYISTSYNGKDELYRVQDILGELLVGRG